VKGELDGSHWLYLADNHGQRKDDITYLGKTDSNDKQPSQYTLQTVKSSSWPSIVKGIQAMRRSLCELRQHKYFL